MVKVYSTPTCPWCVRVKEYLNSKNIDFQDINVAEDRDAAMEMVQKTEAFRNSNFLEYSHTVI
jgi:glutaredoxin